MDVVFLKLPKATIRTIENGVERVPTLPVNAAVEVASLVRVIT
jgi:hypothetical protein